MLHVKHGTELYSQGHGKSLGQVAPLCHSSLTNDQQHKDGNENDKEGVAIGHYQFHQAGLKYLLPPVKKTKRDGLQTKDTLGRWVLKQKASFAVSSNG